ncbi:MAG: tetratricopeptide repeat protein [Nitrososphaerota archaeon]|nr:tetratricopeptide repeat protein [Nitrososphaerota archaeon]
MAMSYSLWVSGAKVFVPAFYQQLFKEGNINTAMLAARKAMYSNKMRDTFTGQVEFHDWIVPVLYQQTIKNVLPKLKPNITQMSKLSNDVKILDNCGFIGRDSTILQLERIIREKPAGILIYGMAGEGKTTLVKGFLQWLEATNGLGENVFWFSFENIYSAEYIINTIANKLFGTQTLALQTEQNLSRVTQELKNKPYFIVWDNFELVSGIPNTDVSALLSEADRTLLKQLLHDLHGGATKVLITSRSPENWLTPRECQRLQLSGLKGQELWQYCNRVVKNLGLSFDRESETYKQLMNKLNGNPLATRAILLRLQEKSANELLAEIDESFNRLDGDETTWRIQATFSVFKKGLNQDFAPVLRLLGLHEQYVDADYLKDMLGATGNPNPQIDECFTTLENAGLCHAVGGLVYRLHPTLRAVLPQFYPAKEDDKRAFVNVMNKLVTVYIDKDLQGQRDIFTLFSMCFHRALEIAQELNIHETLLTLTEALASYALNARNFTEAHQLYTQCYEVAKKYKNIQTEAVAYQKLGVVAFEQRDFVVAECWYTKALQIHQRLGDEQGVAQIYHQLGMIAQNQRNFVTAEKLYKEALTIALKLEDNYGATKTYHGLGAVAQARRDFVTAEEWYSKSLENVMKLGDESGVAQTYHQLGMIAQEQQKIDTAEQWYKKALQINFRLGDEYGVAQTYHQLGVVAFERGHLIAAEDWYTKALQIEQKLGDEYGVAQTYHNLGRVAQEQRDLTTAKDWYTKALQTEQKLGDEYGVAQTYHNLGVVAFEQRDFTVAKKLYIKSLQIKNNLGDEYGVAQTYRNLGIIAEEQRDFTVAKKLYIKSLQISLKLGDEYGVAQTYHNLGVIAFEQRDFTVAKKLYIKSLQISPKLGDEYGVAQTYHNLGMVAWAQRDFTTAKDWYTKAIEIKEKLGDEYSLAQTYQQLGLFSQEQRDFTTAKDWYTKALQTSERLGDEQGVAQTYHNLGLIAFEQRDFIVAMEWYTKSIDITQKSGDEHGIARTYHNLGMIAQEQRDFTTAKDWYTKALQTEQKLGDEYGVAQTYHNLGLIAFEQRDFVTAVEWYNKSLVIKRKLGDEQGKAQTYYQLGRVAFEQRDFTTATEQFNKAIRFSRIAGDESGEAQTYHQLGLIAFEQSDFTAAEKWYSETLQINQKLSDKHGVAQTYHQLGLIAQEQGNFTVAKKWYNKALQIERKLGDEHSIAQTYHNLGLLAQEQRDFTTAKKRYDKALTIYRRLGDESGEAQTYYGLGVVAQERQNFNIAEQLYKKSLEIMIKIDDKHSVANIYRQLGIVSSKRTQEVNNADEWEWDKAARLVEGSANRNLQVLDTKLLTDNPVDARTYLRSDADADERGVRCGAKVLLMGDGGSGKTSLARLWVTGKPINDPHSTRGIVVNEVKRDLKGGQCTLRIWDFGGQGTYRQFHTLFFSDEKFCDTAICIILLDAWKEETPEEWLHYIDTYAKKSHPFLVLNKVDERPRADLDSSRYTNKYPQLYNQVFKLSCKYPEKSIIHPKELFNAVDQKIEEYLGKYSAEYPKSWIDIWDETVKQCCNGKKYLTRQEFTHVCAKYEILNEGTQNTILNQMNCIGTVLTLTDCSEHAYILDPNWVTDGLYKMLDADVDLDDGFALSFNKIKNIFQIYEKAKKYDERYSTNEDILTLLGILEKHKICLRIEDSDNALYFLPALLSAQRPETVPDVTEWQTFVYVFDFLPSSLIHQFMVKHWNETQTHKPIIVWKFGAVLCFTNEFSPETSAIAVVESDQHSIKFHVQKNDDNPELCWKVFIKMQNEMQRLINSHRIDMKTVHQRVKIFVTPNKYYDRTEEYVDINTLHNLRDLKRDKYCLPYSLHEIDVEKEILKYGPLKQEEHKSKEIKNVTIISKVTGPVGNIIIGGTQETVNGSGIIQPQPAPDSLPEGSLPIVKKSKSSGILVALATPLEEQNIGLKATSDTLRLRPEIHIKNSHVYFDSIVVNLQDELTLENFHALLDLLSNFLQTNAKANVELSNKDDARTLNAVIDQARKQSDPQKGWDILEKRIAQGGSIASILMLFFAALDPSAAAVAGVATGAAITGGIITPRLITAIKDRIARFNRVLKNAVTKT